MGEGKEKRVKMTTHVIGQKFASKETGKQTNLVQRIALFILFLACGIAIFVLGSNYYDIFPTNRNLLYNLGLSAVFLMATLGFKSVDRLQKYWPVAFAFFVTSLAMPLTLLLSGWTNSILGWFNLMDSTALGMAIAKVWEMMVIVIPMLVLIKLSGADLGSIYLKRGNLKLGLSVGALVWFNFATSVFLFFALRFTSMEKLGAAIVGGLIFSFTNGFMEEVWLRGIFLKRFQPFLGVGGSVLLTAIVFALFHGNAAYLPSIALPFMIANTVTLGLACGYLIMKTDSIWGAVIIHAAADLFLFIAMLAPI